METDVFEVHVLYDDNTMQMTIINFIDWLLSFIVYLVYWYNFHNITWKYDSSAIVWVQVMKQWYALYIFYILMIKHQESN